MDPHAEGPEGQEPLEDELTLAALSDPADVGRQEPERHPTLWRLVFVVLLAIGALSLVFGAAR
jgi:hypothetical protein